jgi:ADP-ribose pyrophosphatase
MEEIILQHSRFDGRMSNEMSRLVFQRGDSVGILIQDPERGEIILTEQFRMATYDKDTGWLMELPAGMLESGEDPEECARRETFEETGYDVKDLEQIGLFYLSPGGSSERIYLFYTEVDFSSKKGEGVGLEAEDEDIKTHVISTEKAFEMAKSGEIQDAKTLIAIQWLELRNRLKFA